MQKQLFPNQFGGWADTVCSSPLKLSNSTSCCPGDSYLFRRARSSLRTKRSGERPVWTRIFLRTAPSEADLKAGFISDRASASAFSSLRKAHSRRCTRQSRRWHCLKEKSWRWNLIHFSENNFAFIKEFDEALVSHYSWKVSSVALIKQIGVRVF